MTLVAEYKRTYLEAVVCTIVVALLVIALVYICIVVGTFNLMTRQRVVPSFFLAHFAHTLISRLLFFPLGSFETQSFISVATTKASTVKWLESNTTLKVEMI